MQNLKLILLAAFFLLSEAFAVRISYWAYDKTGGLQKKGKYEQKNGGEIPDDKEDYLIQNIGTWSNHAYTAEKTVRNIIVVKAVDKTQTKSGATHLIQVAESLVRQHIPKEKKTEEKSEGKKTEEKSEGKKD
ncbi:hypothetical protein ASPBRDRAFT_49070 [Aspergillus brasiliensis CBS 101740]|uniref:Hypervirulence associated protein TUDOR domain-containing protein n=1 Tax=Aspergillus brasiliensis (strain CBS 101740 / IMI 381727 / IBT 21946) TaxID=767769 RepID=A0A1L9U468_ASPBC|nr:hypothetical protein ASPBRDRAFT_49070 [Aspergillus brasiliensis CBS 101740]